MATTTRTNPSRGTEQPVRPSRSHRIGVIVAGSLVAGLLAAAVLVLGVFGGASENVVGGSALLGFALGWALLWRLSAQRTDQPQRWAAVPAATMAVTGVLMLVWPGVVTTAAFGWVWPAAMLALVVWMTVASRRQLRSRTRPWLLYPLFAIVAVAAVAGSYENVREVADRSAYPMTGQMVDVGGHKLHISCTGTGGPAVVLEGGFAATSATWGWIAPVVAKHTRVCVYDRAGRGWSEPADGPQDGVAIATDLHTLLDHAGVPGPYVLVGHSFGGLYVLTFAARYPQLVAGMVLLDSTSPHQFTLPAYPATYEAFRRATGLFPALSRVGVTRMAFTSPFATLPALSRDEETAFASTAAMARSQRDEWAEAPTAMEQARALTTLGARPLFVLTAGNGAQDGWMPLQDQLAALSTNSIHRVLPDATHASMTDHQREATESSQAILSVVAAVRDALHRFRSTSG
jgi:pimeloyl-ACP methyl ester carboxylesterase